MKLKTCGVEVELVEGTRVMYGREELGWVILRDAHGFWGAHSWWSKDGSVDPSGSSNAGMHGSRKAAVAAIVTRALDLGRVTP